jgi:hypothetical protein
MKTQSPWPIHIPRHEISGLFTKCAAGVITATACNLHLHGMVQERESSRGFEVVRVGYEEFCLLGYDALLTRVETQPTFSLLPASC